MVCVLAKCGALLLAWVSCGRGVSKALDERLAEFGPQLLVGWLSTFVVLCGV